MKKRLFVDMDGVLAVFKPVAAIEELYEKDRFLNLDTNKFVVKAINQINETCRDDFDVHILSSVLTDSKYALAEKNAWLDKYLPGIDSDHRIFPPCGEDKNAYVPNGTRKTDYLLDDYTKNLLSWETEGTGIKLLNGLNHTMKTWKGMTVDFGEPASVLASDIADCMEFDRCKEYIENPSLLPESCYTFKGLTREIIKINAGVGGYTETESSGEFSLNLLNKSVGATDDMRKAFELGAKHFWQKRAPDNEPQMSFEEIEYDYEV
jgi:5'(3')-deoxyribonucleotidase